MKLAEYDQEHEDRATPLPDLKKLNLAGIAGVVRQHWHPVSFAAVPYLAAMDHLDNLNEKFEADPATEIVVRFLTGASTWRGEAARAVKTELKSRLKAAGF